MYNQKATHLKSILNLKVKYSFFSILTLTSLIYIRIIYGVYEYIIYTKYVTSLRVLPLELDIDDINS